jgi:CheY-like chemotaxis protein
VLVNLIGNAIKFTPEGEVAVHVSVQSRTNRETLLRLSIRDTGIGIPESKKHWIFEAFHQTDSSVTRRFGGTGLGLAISSQLIQLMYGSIQVESKEGAGTVFYVDVPFTLTGAAESVPAVSLSGRRVVILSDHAESELAVRQMLEFLGVPAESAEAPADPHSPAVLIADLSGSSFGLLDEVTQRICVGEIHREDVLCLIPAGRSDLLNACDSRDIEQVLTKPVKPRELAQAIRAVIERTPPADLFGEPRFDSSPCSLFVLVADDSPVNREVATGMLELCGHRVHTVTNGKEAVQVLEEEAFDLVFMDLEMPVMDGLAATRAIRRLSSEKSRVPIYAMTAHALSETDKQCREAGMDGFITKPIVPDQLIELLNRVSKAKSTELIADR